MKTRKIISAVLVLTMLFMTLCATGCENDPFKKTDETLFKVLFDRENANTLDIRSVDAYKYKNVFYYEVKSSIMDTEKEERVNFNYLFYGTRKLENSLDLAADDLGAKEKDKEAYLEAKENGEHKRLESEYVHQKFDDYFLSSDVNYVTIDPTEEDFEAANKPEYNNTKEVITDQTIAKPYDVKLFCYKAPVGGYYKVYTTGETDTLGKLFKRNEFMGRTTGYEAITTTVDGRGQGSNFLTIKRFDENAHYYVGVRGFSTETGDYTLVIEPNDDKVYSNIGGMWVNDSATSGPASITYLNKYQVDELYHLFTDEEALKTVRTEYKKDGMFAALDALRMKGLTKLSYYAKEYAFSDQLGTFTLKQVTAIISGSIPTTQAMLSEMFETCCQKDKLEEVKAQLEAICKVSENSNAVCGIKIIRKNDFWSEKYTYEAFNGIEMCGEYYEKGLWY